MKILATRILTGVVKLVFLAILVLSCSTTMFAQETVLGHFPTENRPIGGVAVNALTNRIYILGRGTNVAAMLSVVDGSTNEVISNIDLSGMHPVGQAVNPITNRIYVVGFGNDGVGLIVVDGSNNSVIESINLSDYPEFQNDPFAYDVAVNPQTNRIYLLNNTDVLVLDGATNSFVGLIENIGGLASVDIDGFPSGFLDVNAITNLIYVANSNLPGLKVADGATNSVITTIYTDDLVLGIAINQLTNRIYLDCRSGLAVVDGTTNLVITNIPYSDDSNGVAVNITTNRIYRTGLINIHNPELMVMDGATNSVIGDIRTDTLGEEDADGSSVAVNPTTNRIYIAGLYESPDSVSFQALTVLDGGGNYTAAGNNVAVIPIDPTTGTVPATLTFSSVIQTGDTNVTSSTSGPSPTSGFKVGEPAVFYDISTTAAFAGAVTLCFTWNEGQFDNESNIALFHYENGAWQDVTTSLNTSGNQVCGQTFSLSPFAIFETSYTFTGFFSPVDNPPTRNVAKAGSAVPVKFSLNGNQGLAIFASGYPASQPVQCDSSAPLSDIEETVTAGGNSLSYDSLFDKYIYVWKTNKAWANSCRRFVLHFNDGSVKTADFTFSK